MWSYWNLLRTPTKPGEKHTMQRLHFHHEKTGGTPPNNGTTNIKPESLVHKGLQPNLTRL